MLLESELRPRVQTDCGPLARRMHWLDLHLTDDDFGLIFMHAVFLADLAAMISQNAPSIAFRQNIDMSAAVTNYWTHTRARFELWHHAITRYRYAEQGGEGAAIREWWNRHSILLEEILVSEILCRVIAALGKTMDVEKGIDDVSPITDTVFRSHLEVCSRVHHLMLFGRGSSVRNTVRLNRLRQGVERWTDALLGRMIPYNKSALGYAIDPDRATAYAEECVENEAWAQRETSCLLFNTAMHEMLVQRSTPHAALPRANQRVADSVMGMFNRDVFDSVGVLKSRWLRELENNAGTEDRQPTQEVIHTKHHAIAARHTKNNVDVISQRWCD
ncbi:hypothetical protein Pla52o_21210 [Novipirellula galeiformis]|uniref:Uncharacterized protein n=2 Tax=Novipirellula galeiformis TaxID=2528004 RepID=A0A5C6CJB8_9BACT|nr:hypothetical protein Pla52o_21210 [Novipirellula galeiformis]